MTVSSSPGGLITGRIVERDSGSRRVKKRDEDCRYILDIWEEACREEEESSCEDRVSRVEERVVAIDVVEAIIAQCQVVAVGGGEADDDDPLEVGMCLCCAFHVQIGCRGMACF